MINRQLEAINRLSSKLHIEVITLAVGFIFSFLRFVIGLVALVFAPGKRKTDQGKKYIDDNGVNTMKYMDRYFWLDYRICRKVDVVGDPNEVIIEFKDSRLQICLQLPTSANMIERYHKEGKKLHLLTSIAMKT